MKIGITFHCKTIAEYKEVLVLSRSLYYEHDFIHLTKYIVPEPFGVDNSQSILEDDSLYWSVVFHWHPVDLALYGFSDKSVLRNYILEIVRPLVSCEVF